MGKRGPKGKSPELESAQGFPGRRKGKTKAVLARQSEPEIADETDIQDDVPDSRFVQPPPYLISKPERIVWSEIMGGPNARLWFKFSDHAVIARYCQLSVAYRRLTKSLPKPTYKTKGTAGGDVIKRNPAFDQMLALSRELRAIEQLIAGNPDSRLNMEKKGLKPGEKTPNGDKPDEPSKPGKPTGPLGVLKASHKMN